MLTNQLPDQYQLFLPLETFEDTASTSSALPSDHAKLCALPKITVSFGTHRLGRASLVGVGPGDPDLITVKALKVLRQADVILYDSLVNPLILDHAKDGARRIDVGKRCGRHSMSQLAINNLILAEVKAGHHVVRLKGGDPFVFGRGGEELEALRSVGAEVEVVPGITTACAAAANLCIPLTHRGIAQGLHFITGHGADDDQLIHDWRALAQNGGTLAVYMGSKTIDRVIHRLITAGLSPETPSLAIQNVSLANERFVQSELKCLGTQIRQLDETGPILILIGKVISLANNATDAQNLSLSATQYAA